MQKLIKILGMALAVSANAGAEAAQVAREYSEKWRPQYHFTPAHRWIGDPCGLVYADGKFHAYSWGGAESDDLIHWREINNQAIEGIPQGIAPFTGSVVVDRRNTAGYGEGAYIAAFTSFDEQSKKQSQSIAFSRDKGKTFQYYDLNPVIDIWSTEFRDPTVIWDEKTGRWIMLVAKALEKKVAFYSSTDLKHWEWLSDFGPMGDNEKSWECPDMFRLPIQGTDQSKWVLVVSVNWGREQYFVGEFDGVNFIPDVKYGAPLYIDSGLDYYASRVFQDFDGTLSDVYSVGWVSTWDYAQHVPTEYGKGVWSLPRELTLKQTSDGLRLVQRPLRSLASLRQNGESFSKILKSGYTPIPSIAKLGNQYEVVADFKVNEDDIFGLNLCIGNSQHVSLIYDVTSQTLVLNRVRSTCESIPKFERLAYTEVPLQDGMLKLDVYVDKSVAEIYVNDGECVMTALTFPSDSAVGAEIFSLSGTTHVELSVCGMKSIWEKARANNAE